MGSLEGEVWANGKQSGQVGRRTGAGGSALAGRPQRQRWGADSDAKLEAVKLMVQLDWGSWALTNLTSEFPPYTQLLSSLAYTPQPVHQLGLLACC